MLPDPRPHFQLAGPTLGQTALYTVFLSVLRVRHVCCGNFRSVRRMRTMQRQRKWAWRTQKGGGERGACQESLPERHCLIESVPTFPRWPLATASLVASTYRNLLHRHECFTGMRKTHTKLHPGLDLLIFHSLTNAYISKTSFLAFIPVS